MCSLLVGLPTVTVLGVVDLIPSLPLTVYVETTLKRRALRRLRGCREAQGP